MNIAAAIIVMAVLGALLGVIIGLFVRLFRVQRDPRADLALELLPGANCGGCGFAGCADFSRALASGRAVPANCPVSSAEQISAISMALGINPGTVERKQAVVFCRADVGDVPRMNYNGVQDCVAANLVAGGPDACRHGCLGLGSCARKCPFGAIEIVGRVAVVHRELCVGCGKCVAACPRGVIKLVPASAEWHVLCNSPEKGAVKRTFCKAGCIGCGKCARLYPDEFKLSGFLASVNYAGENLPGEEEAAKIKCPAGGLTTLMHRLDAAHRKVKEAKYNE